MGDITRRGFTGLSLAGVAAIGLPRHQVLAAQCAAGGMPALVPNRLAVGCASRQNFRLFRQYSSYVGLAGVVSMIDAAGPGGSYRAGSLYLFPWLKPKGLALRTAPLRAALPTGTASSTTTAKPIPGSVLPQDEYLCRFVLRAPWRNFIGFTVDTPLTGVKSQPAWYTDIPKLADGQAVGIDWTSSNLNAAWFGGSSTIPDQDFCNGNAWRALIADGLNQVSVDAC